jgi:hypothetical protein
LKKFIVDEIRDPTPNDKSVTFRLPYRDFEKLREIDANLSTTLRYIVAVFLDEQTSGNERIESWKRKR